MSPTRSAVLTAGLILIATTVAATSIHKSAAPAVTREVIAVYLGTEGTDGGMAMVVGDMQSALSKQASAGGYRFVARGVSLEPSVQGGLRHLARLGSFDEVSVGGNWGNSTVVRYLGGTDHDSVHRSIPQVVLLEREVGTGDRSVDFGPERELADTSA
jgi:hypothetical protein